jgi:hypothetical protein
VQVKVVERDFTRDGKMKIIGQKDRKDLNGYLPFFSVDTREEADAVIAEALRVGELWRQADGTIVETTLLHEQTIENLRLAGERMAEIHQRLYPQTGANT